MRTPPRFDLREELARVNAEMVTVKGKLSAAKAEAATKHRYLPHDQYQNLLLRLDALKVRKLRIEGQLAATKGGGDGYGFLEAFIDSAREYLDSVDFSNIETLARQKVVEHRQAVSAGNES